jgi:dUTP pyrophosphatase
MKVFFKKLNHFDDSFSLPSFESDQAAGADLRACFENKKGISVEPWERVLIPTGLSMSFEAGYEVQVRPRSGLSFKTPLIIPNSPGTIDSDYRGEIKVIIANMSNCAYFITHGDRIAQMVFSKVFRPNFIEIMELDVTNRGENGFGSSGINNGAMK